MADVIDLILADHSRIRELFAELDRLMDGPASPGRPDAPGPAWTALATLVETHLDAEQEICGLLLYRRHGLDAGQAATANDIREAIGEARLQPPGSVLWRAAIRAACIGVMRHIDDTESGLLAQFKEGTSQQARHLLAKQWIAFVNARALDG